MASSSQTPNKTYLPFRGVKNDPAFYLALDPTSRQIRYVDLHPGSTTDPLVCTLGYATLDPDADDKLLYEALSYCWGSVDDVVDITLHIPDGNEAQNVIRCNAFKVTRNLEEALRALRPIDKARRLWVDAICINQMDDNEKTHQVGQMNLIYSSAMHVVVWLGLEDTHSSTIFRCHERFELKIQNSSALQHLTHPDLLSSEDLSRLKTITRSFSRSMLRDPQMTEFFRSNVEMKKLSAQPNSPSPPEMHQLFGSSIDHLLSRPWFHRIWVYPEVFLAPRDKNGRRLVTVVIGACKMPWVNLVQLVRAASVFPNAARTYERSWTNIIWFLHAWNFPEDRKVSQSLADYVQNTRNFLASDPRDKIFALLHIAQDTRDRIHTDPRLLPDYGLSMFDVVLNYVSLSIFLVSEVTVARPIRNRGHADTRILDFGFRGSVVFGKEVHIKATRIACVQRFHGHAKVDTSQIPKGCRSTFVSTDGRLYAVNCFLAPKDEIFTYSEATTPFVLTPCPSPANTYLLRGACLCYPLSIKEDRAHGGEIEMTGYRAT